MVQHVPETRTASRVGKTEWQHALEQISSVEATANPNGRVYSGAARACGSRWWACLQILGRLSSQAVRDKEWSLVVSFGTAISASAESQCWKVSLCLSKHLQRAGLQPNTVLCNASISAGEKGGQWLRALANLERITYLSLLADVISCSAAISACEKRAQWKAAMLVLGTLRWRTLKPNTISYSSALSACAKEGRWQQALLFEMRRHGMQVGTITYNCQITSCHQGRTWQQSLMAWSEMRQAKLRESAATCGAVATAMGGSMRWQQSVSFLQPQDARDFSSNKVVHASGVSACGVAERWESALQVVSALQGGLVRCGVETFNACIMACAKPSLWQTSLKIFSRLRVTPSQLDLVGWNGMIDSFKQSLKWQLSLLMVVALAHVRVLADAFTFTSGISVCGKAKAWLQSTLLLRQASSQRVRVNSVLCNAFLNALERGHQWVLASRTLDTMQRWRLQPSVNAYDSAMLACQHSGHSSHALRLLHASDELRSPVSLLWSMATLGASEPAEIHAACREAAVQAQAQVEELPYLLWSCAMLGVASPHSRRRAAERQLLRSLAALDMQELSMAVYGAAASVDSADIEFLSAAQETVRARLLQAGDMERLAFNAGAQELLGILFACNLGGVLQDRFREALAGKLRDVGLYLDACTDHKVKLRSSFLPPAHGQIPKIIEDTLDRCVLCKPEGWEVYGQHVKLQLSTFVRGMFGSAPIFTDPDHNYGFLHRLDVPSSGLILVAKTYEAFYDLQVQLHAGGVRRDYTVLCHGWLPRSLRCLCASTVCPVDAPTVAGGQGRRSMTHVLFAEHYQYAAGTVSRAVLSIATGRKHQIRCHFAHVGHPTVRDKIYGSRDTFRQDGGLCMRNWLHRFGLSFTDAKGSACNVSSDLPEDLKQSLSNLSQKM